MRFHFAIVGLAALALSDVAAAKCINHFFRISGQIHAASGSPVAGARVTASWREFNSEPHVSALSGSDGRYSLKIEFDSLSNVGSDGSDICLGKLETVTLVVSKTAYAAIRRKVPVSEGETTADFSLMPMEKVAPNG